MRRKALDHSESDDGITEYDILKRAAKMRLDSAILACADHTLNPTERFVLKTLIAEAQLTFLETSKKDGFDVSPGVMKEGDLGFAKLLLEPVEWKQIMAAHFQAKIRAEQKIFQKQTCGELPKNYDEMNKLTLDRAKRKRGAAESPDEEGKVQGGLFTSKPSKRQRTTASSESKKTTLMSFQNKRSGRNPG